MKTKLSTFALNQMGANLVEILKSEKGARSKLNSLDLSTKNGQAYLNAYRYAQTLLKQTFEGQDVDVNRFKTHAKQILALLQQIKREGMQTSILSLLNKTA